jgi:hypothetical protein
MHRLILLVHQHRKCAFRDRHLEMPLFRNGRCVCFTAEGTASAVYLRVSVASSTDVALRWLVLAVADAEVMPDFGELVEFGEEFIH